MHTKNLASDSFSVMIALPNKFLDFWGAIMPCFAAAPLRGECYGIRTCSEYGCRDDAGGWDD